MAGQISINPEHVRQVAGKFKQTSDQSNQLVQQLGAAVNGLQNEWKGVSQQTFFQDYQQWTAQMRKYVEMLNSISQELNVIAQRFEETDRTVAAHR